MSTLFALLCAAVALVLSLSLLGFSLVTLGFAGESHKSGMTLLHHVFNTLAVLISLAPLVLTLWASWRRFFSSRPWEDVPLGWGLPLVACVACAVTSFLTFIAGEWVSSHQSKWREAEERAALRVEVERGANERACDLVLMDPLSTPEDMRRCREHIESLSTPEARWAELRKFRGAPISFKTWKPKEVGLAPEWEWNGPRYLVAVRHDQEWFVRTYYETWLAQPGAFQSQEELERLNRSLSDTTRRYGWTPAAIEALKAHVIPKLVTRVESQQVLPRDTPTMKWLWDSFTELQQPSGKADAPPTPKLDAVPEGSIGLAKLDHDGALHLFLRATPSTGAFGDVYLYYPASDEHFRSWKRHLGSMDPGEVRPVPPLD